MSDQTHLRDPRWNPDQHSLREFEDGDTEADSDAGD